MTIDKWDWRTVIKVDNQVIIDKNNKFSLIGIKSYDLIIGIREKHDVTIRIYTPYLPTLKKWYKEVIV